MAAPGIPEQLALNQAALSKMSDLAREHQWSSGTSVVLKKSSTDAVQVGLEHPVVTTGSAIDSLQSTST